MSEVEMVQDVDSLPDTPGSAGQPSAGALLTQMRESAGIHLATLAATLKVPESKLAALEADRCEAFAEPVFMRALASSVCRVLQTDAAPVLALLPSGKPAPLRVDHGLNAAFKEPGVRKPGAGSGFDQPKSRTLGFVVAALLLGALAIAFFPHDRFGAGAKPDELAQSAAASAEAASTDSSGQAGAPALEPAAPAAPATEAQEPVAAAQQTTSPPQPAPVQPVMAVAVPAAPDAAAAAVADATLLIRATGQSWVQVRGTDGKVVLEKLLTAGQSVAVPGSPPWSVVVGKADVTEVLVRGKAMDLSAVARENVARFEVK